MDHFLFHCEAASVLWSAIFGRFGISWVMPRRVSKLFACWWSSGRRGTIAVWKMVPTCLFWCLWRERNNRCFEDLERSSEDILSSCLHTLYLWTIAFVSPMSISYNDFLVCFSFSTYVIHVVYALCTLGCLSFLIRLIITYKKKKKFFNLSIMVTTSAFGMYVASD